VVATVSDPEEFRREVLVSMDPIIALFYADWCPFCRRYLPVFEAYAANARVRFVGVNISDEDNPLWEEYNIDVVPTLIHFRGGRAVNRIDGTLGVGLKERQLKELLQSPVPKA
jgi:thioredoxin 1